MLNCKIIMKYSIFINPKSQNSSAIIQAYEFVQAIREDKFEHISVFFYGYAVKCAFYNGCQWKMVNNSSISLYACSTIAQEFLTKNQKVHENFTIAGLGQWLDSTLKADKNIEFI